ncbi:MAG: PKD domain-containing protein [Anaerolineae bacterium]
MVTDARGLAAGQTVVTVHDTAITALSASNNSPTVLGQATAFTATASGSNIGYEWAFGDGSGPVSGAMATHTYGLAGHYTATVTATNSVSVVVASTLI